MRENHKLRNCVVQSFKLGPRCMHVKVLYTSFLSFFAFYIFYPALISTYVFINVLDT